MGNQRTLLYPYATYTEPIPSVPTRLTLRSSSTGVYPKTGAQFNASSSKWCLVAAREWGP